MSDVKGKKDLNVPDTCPHCGEKLSPWQQVLLGIDRSLMCKKCWYRIILDVYGDEAKDQGREETQQKE